MEVERDGALLRAQFGGPGGVVNVGGLWVKLQPERMDLTQVSAGDVIVLLGIIGSITGCRPVAINQGPRESASGR